MSVRTQKENCGRILTYQKKEYWAFIIVAMASFYQPSTTQSSKQNSVFEKLITTEVTQWRFTETFLLLQRFEIFVIFVQLFFGVYSWKRHDRRDA